MKIEGFVIHHSACGQDPMTRCDFAIHGDSSVTSSPVLRHRALIHICLEGNFNRRYELLTPAEKSQLFTASKIIMELSDLHDISPLYLFPHADDCPGADFPWNALVIYPADGYH